MWKTGSGVFLDAGHQTNADLNIWICSASTYLIFSSELVFVSNAEEWRRVFIQAYLNQQLYVSVMWYVYCRWLQATNSISLPPPISNEGNKRSELLNITHLFIFPKTRGTRRSSLFLVSLTYLAMQKKYLSFCQCYKKYMFTCYTRVDVL